jgi:hypothetical protein
VLDLDQIDIFWQKIRELMAKLGLASIDPLVECLPEDLKLPFNNLVNNYSPKYEELKKEEA